MTWEEVPLFDLPPVPGPNNDVMTVWEFWLETLRYNSKTRVVMSDKRRRKIEKALEQYDVQTCLDAISGCAQSDFHQGRNGRGTKYDDIELILRDPEHIERFSSEFRDSKELGF
jgi:hypothetical protein